MWRTCQTVTVPRRVGGDRGQLGKCVSWNVLCVHKTTHLRDGGIGCLMAVPAFWLLFSQENFLSLSICRVLSGRMPGARVSCIAPAPPCAAVCHGGLCWLFASATLVRRGSDVRSLFCFLANVRNAVLIAAKCPGLSLRSCAAVCDRSPYPLPASSPWPIRYINFFFYPILKL